LITKVIDFPHRFSLYASFLNWESGLNTQPEYNPALPTLNLASPPGFYRVFIRVSFRPNSPEFYRSFFPSGKRNFDFSRVFPFSLTQNHPSTTDNQDQNATINGILLDYNSTCVSLCSKSMGAPTPCRISFATALWRRETATVRFYVFSLLPEDSQIHLVFKGTSKSRFVKAEWRLLKG
jgi:hypothetical protein